MMSMMRYSIKTESRSVLGIFRVSNMIVNKKSIIGEIICSLKTSNNFLVEKPSRVPMVVPMTPLSNKNSL